MSNHVGLIKNQSSTQVDAFVSTDQIKEAIIPNPRKPYGAPQLNALGDLRAVTFGSYVGDNDSGNTTSFDSGIPLP